MSDDNDPSSSSSSSSQWTFSIQKLELAADNILQNNFDVVSKPCFITIIKLLDNVIQKPNLDMYKTIKLSNTTIQKKIVACRGGIEFLLSCGFLPLSPPSQQHQSQEQLQSLIECGFLSSQTQSQPQTTTTTTIDTTSNILQLVQHEINIQNLITARRLLATRCIQDLDCRSEDLPTYRPPPEVVPLVNTDTQSSSSTANAGAFNPYRGQRFDGLSAAAGTNLGPPKNYKSKTERELEILQKQQAKLERQLQKQNVTANRDWQIIVQQQQQGEAIIATSLTTAGGTSSTKGDANLLAARAKQQMEESKKSSQFATSAMRNLEKIKKQKVFSHTVLQFQLSLKTTAAAASNSNNTTPTVVISIRGKFLPQETIGHVQNVLVSDCFTAAEPSQQNLEFHLLAPPSRNVLDRKLTLSALGLVPAAKLVVRWKNNNGKTTAPSISVLAESLRTVVLGHNGGTNTTTTAAAASTMAYPASKPVVMAAGGGTMDEDDEDSKKPAAVDNGKKKDKDTREDDMLRRMMGGSGSSGSSSILRRGGGTNKKKSDNKPKWFKG